MTVDDYVEKLVACLESPVVTGARSMERAMAAVVGRIRSAGTVYLVGNGGSAAVVAHAQNDLMKVGHVRALTFQDVPLLTACANDRGYTESYAAPLRWWIADTDVLIAVSSSGASKNILAAVAAAKDARALVVTYSGFQPSNPLRAMGDINFYVPSSDYGHVELTHAALLHCLTDRLAVHA